MMHDCPYCHGLGYSYPDYNDSLIDELIDITCIHCGGTGELTSNLEEEND